MDRIEYTKKINEIRKNGDDIDFKYHMVNKAIRLYTFARIGAGAIDIESYFKGA